MYNGKTILAVIPARGNSKSVPRKNLHEVCGRPLISWTFKSAQNSTYIDRLVLSSEDDEIIAVAHEYGVEVPFKRPPELAGDDVVVTMPVIDVAQKLPGYDYTVTLQPSVPLRTADDIDGCVAKCIDTGAASCATLAESGKSPYWMYLLGEDSLLLPLIEQKEEGEKQRQELPTTYLLNGAVYVAQTDWLIKGRRYLSRETIGYVMPQERSLDIDTDTDLWLLEYFETLS